MISGLNEQLLQELEYTLLKPDCHRWWISKMQRLSLWDNWGLKEVIKVIDKLTHEDFHGAFQKLLERYNKSIAAGRDYFERD